MRCPRPKVSNPSPPGFRPGTSGFRPALARWVLAAAAIPLLIAAPSFSQSDRRSSSQARKARSSGSTGTVPESTDSTAIKAAESKQDVAPQIRGNRSGMQGFGRTAEEEKLLDEISRVIAAYENESREFKREVQQ